MNSNIVFGERVKACLEILDLDENVDLRCVMEFMNLTDPQTYSREFPKVEGALNQGFSTFEHLLPITSYQLGKN